MKDKIIQIIKDACALEEEVKENSDLKTLSLDSLSFVEMLVNIENEFEIEFEDEELNFFDWENVSDLINAVKEKLNAKEST